MKLFADPNRKCSVVQGPCLCLIDEGQEHCLRLHSRRLLPQLDRIMQIWETNYRTYFANNGYFDPDKVRLEYREQIRAVLTDMANGNLEQLLKDLHNAGERFRELGVPFDEVVSSAPLFVESCLAVLRNEGYDDSTLLTAYIALVRLSHVRIVELSKSYYQADKAWTGEQLARVEEELASLRSSIGVRDQLCGLVGGSTAMQKVFTRIEICAKTRETVLLTGESGTGKELAARAIHLCSGDPPERWVVVNCATIQPHMMVAMLSGHRKGAFTGALESRMGLVRSAEGGTLFLDEITEMTPDAQAALLRIIQERCVLPLGETREIPVTVRLIASTNQPLEKSVREGKLRRDLYYRLQRLIIEIPSLREHLEDLPQLVSHFAEQWRRSNQATVRPRFSLEALAKLTQNSWLGNVRELENTVFSVCSFAAGPIIEAADVEARLKSVSSPAHTDNYAPVALREAERATIVRAMALANGNKSQAARLLGMSRKQLYVKIHLYQLDEP
jgi:DNA-binding NtrC family response regulator